MSKYFSLSEMTHSDTAIRLGIPNDPNKDQIMYLEQLMEYLDGVREELGHPIIVTSGFRSGGDKGLNAAVGGKPESQHTMGQAADIVPHDRKLLKKLLHIIWDRGGFDQLIWEHPKGRSEWIHVSIAGKNKTPRGQVLEYDGKRYMTMKKPINPNTL